MITKDLPLVSFVIPHKGREGMLIETLHSIAEQRYPNNKIEVVLVSQNETISSQLEQLQDRLTLTVLFHNEQTTISHLRNLGAGHCNGHYLAFLDADIALSKNWIACMLDTITSKPGTVLASAMQINSDNAPSLERIRTSLSNAELDTTVNFLPGRNLFLAKETFSQVGGFPEHLITCEDYYFTDQVAKLGDLFYTSKAHYIHIGEDKAYFPMFKKELWRGQSNIASLKGRKIPLREVPSFIVPLGVVISFLFALISTAYNVSIALTFLVLCLLPVCVYSLRLKSLVSNEVSLLHCFWFYVVYFPARAIGTVMGIGQTINTGTHK